MAFQCLYDLSLACTEAILYFVLFANFQFFDILGRPRADLSLGHQDKNCS